MPQTKPTPRPPRPFRPSRKRFQEALRCLKTAISLDTLPWSSRLRACELLLACYEVAPVAPIPPMTGHQRKVVRDLVQDAAFDGQVRKAVRAKMTEQIEAEERDRLATIPAAQLAADNFIAGRNTQTEDHNE